MPLRYVKGNALNSPKQTLCCTVNCVGVMGAGIAKSVRDAYPEVFKVYRELCFSGELTIDSLFTVDTHIENRQVLLFPTKQHWRYPSKTEWIEYNLSRLSEDYELLEIESLAMVPPGGSLGKIPRNIVNALVEKYLGHPPIEIDYYG